MSIKEKKLLLLKIFVMETFDNQNFKVTYLPSKGKAIVEDINKDVIFLTAKDNNIVECSEGDNSKVFRRLQLVKAVSPCTEDVWRVLC